MMREFDECFPSLFAVLGCMEQWYEKFPFCVLTLDVKQVSAEDDPRYRYRCVHYSYERQGCQAAAELDGCAVLWQACKLDQRCIDAQRLSFWLYIYFGLAERRQSKLDPTGRVTPSG